MHCQVKLKVLHKDAGLSCGSPISVLNADHNLLSGFLPKVPCQTPKAPPEIMFPCYFSRTQLGQHTIRQEILICGQLEE